MNDLRAAAERLLKWAERHEAASVSTNAKAMIYDCGKVAIAYLAEHPAYGDEPITEEWLRSVGFVEADMGLRLNTEFTGRHHLRHTCIFRHLTGEWWVNGLGCATPQTRSDLRRLAKCLGVKLKGEA